jgi:hypothetical protein
MFCYRPSTWLLKSDVDTFVCFHRTTFRSCPFWGLEVTAWHNETVTVSWKLYMAYECVINVSEVISQSASICKWPSPKEAIAFHSDLGEKKIEMQSPTTKWSPWWLLIGNHLPYRQNQTSVFSLSAITESSSQSYCYTIGIYCAIILPGWHFSLQLVSACFLSTLLLLCAEGNSIF